MKYAFIHDHSRSYRITTLCYVLDVSQRGFYDWRNRPDAPRTLENEALLVEIRSIFYENREVVGAPRIHKELRCRGLVCSLNRVARIMRKAGVIPKTIKKFRITTDSKNSHHPAKNLLNRDFSTSRCNEKWVADVTYIPTREGWLFLAVVLDLFSRRVVGWSMGTRLNSELSKRALRDAITRRKDVKGLLHHSDRGREYYARDYQAVLSENDMICSMSRKGNCWDNAVMESFFHSLKVEQVHHDDYRTRSEARSTIFNYIEIFYNRQRRHSSIKYLSPIEYEKLYG